MAGSSRQFVITNRCYECNEYITLIRLDKDINLNELENIFIEEVVKKNKKFMDYTDWPNRSVDNSQIKEWYMSCQLDKNTCTDYIQEFLCWLSEYSKGRFEFSKYNIEEYVI